MLIRLALLLGMSFRLNNLVRMLKYRRKRYGEGTLPLGPTNESVHGFEALN